MKQTRGRRVQAKKYIEKVIQESCDAENRKNDVVYDILIIDDDLLFAIKSKWARVRRRVYFRLRNNLLKNFGLHFHLVHPRSPREDYESWEGTSYSVSDSIDPNNTFMFWDLFGKKVSVSGIWGIRPDAELGLPHLTVLKSHGYDYCDDQDVKNWKLFVNAYKEAYGEEPIEGFRKAKAYWKIVNQHRATYNKDLEEHGCGYWSVCWEHGASCPCSPDAPVSKGFSEETWQSLASDKGDE